MAGTRCSYRRKRRKPWCSRIYSDVLDVIRTPDVTAKLQTAGFEVSGITPAEFGQYMDRELRKRSAVIKDGGIKPE
jgi:hypothetical protein